MGVFRQAKKDFDIVLLIAVIALGVGFIGWFQPIHDTTNLGQWNGFPNPNGLLTYSNISMGSTAIACSVGVLSNKTLSGGAGDYCQLFNSSGYWTVLAPPSTNGIIQVTLEVGCVSPAIPTMGGSVLYLQYANYTASSNLWENTTNFIFLPGQQAIYIDNTLNWDCPGTLVSQSNVNLPSSALPGNGFIFRVVGVCSCNSTTSTAGNPILSFVSIIVRIQLDSPIFVAEPFAILTTSFKYQGSTNIAVSASTNVNVQWIATNNGVVIQSGTTSAICTIPINSVKCSSSTITFPVAFASTPNVVVSVIAPFAGNPIIIPIGTYDFFRTQLAKV
jgi:hypothetical protein